MSPETESRAAAPELDAEQEVDFGRYWRAVVVRWWLPVAGIVAGAVIGYLATLGESRQYKATAQVYLGQPLSPGGATPVTSAPTNLGLVANLVTGEETIRRIAARVGLKPGKLRGHVSAKPIVGLTGARLGTPAPLMAITVTGSPARKIADAANALGEDVVRELSDYTKTKIESLKEQLAYDEGQIASTNARLAAARRQHEEILGNPSLGVTERLLLLANVNTTLITLEARLGQLEADRFETRQQLSLAEDIEQARIVQRGIATRTEGPSRRSSVLVGAVIGLLLGLIAAVLWDPVAERVRARQA